MKCAFSSANIAVLYETTKRTLLKSVKGFEKENKEAGFH